MLSAGPGDRKGSDGRRANLERYFRRTRPIGRLFNDLKDAVRGSAHDYTTGSLGRAVFLLSVPMVLEMVLESVFAVVDIY